MTEPFQIPPTAAYIWLSGDTLNLSLPATHGERGHTVTLPTHEAGLRAFLAILQKRAMSVGRMPIGTPGSPIQHDLQKQIAAAHAKLDNENALKRELTQAERDAADALLNELGL